jgi:uncharacterized protein YyaL (SSP411 family)
MMLAGPLAIAAEPPPALAPISSETFARARAEQRFVILDLAAVWCHWCHVMEETTYRDPDVTRLIADKFIAVRVDQDSSPELSRRYEDWGWPATIIFAPDGSELVKRRGYIPPAAFAALLSAIIADPAPGPSVQPEPAWQPSAGARLAPELRRALTHNFLALYDRRHGGWGWRHKFVDAEALELALVEPRYRALARQTLDAALQLIDPVWGGIYQYSDSLDWKSPHYEKIMSLQAQSLEMFVMANNIWHQPRHLQAAERIARYLTTFLVGPDGAFYVSQDADLSPEVPGKLYYARDDAGRRALGLPRVDSHVYARENGWAITALARLYAATHDEEWLSAAQRAAEQVAARCRRADGGYAHGEGDGDGPFLGDTLAMGEAYAELAAVAPAGPWLERAVGALDYLDAHFADTSAGGAGYVTATPARGARGAGVAVT